MTDFLMRGDAPLSGEEWAKLDKVVIDVARKLLVGRRIVELTGPLGSNSHYGTCVVHGSPRRNIFALLMRQNSRLLVQNGATRYC